MIQLSQNEIEGPNWQDLIQDVLRHWLLIAIFFVFTTAGTYVTLQLMTPKYESTAALLVKLGRENMQVPNTVNAGSVFSSGVRAEEINSGVRDLDKVTQENASMVDESNAQGVALQQAARDLSSLVSAFKTSK